MEKELESMQKFYNIIIEFFVNYSFQIVGAIIISLLLVFISQKKFLTLIEKICLAKDMDITLN